MNAREITLSSARWWQRKTNGVQCNLCPRGCFLRDTERGSCFIRQNIAGELKTPYGAIGGLAIDPIEKKPLYHFLPGSRVLSLGAIGCNLDCQFCQNWHLSKPVDLHYLVDFLEPSQAALMAKKESCPSVAFTYNDPVISAEYVVDASQSCRELGIKTVAVTAGYISEAAREDFFRNIDAANIDLKAFSNDFYEKFCHARLQPILDTLVYVKQRTAVWLEITNLLIPGQNDSDTEITQMSRWIIENLGVDVPVHFSAFHPDYRFYDAEITPKETLLRARDIAIRCGIRYVYTGNVSDVESSHTFCYNCKKVLVARNGYKVAGVNLKGSRCALCQAQCAGYFL